MKQLDKQGPKGQPPEQETSKTFRFQTPIPKLPDPKHETIDGSARRETIYELLGIDPKDSSPGAISLATEALIGRLRAFDTSTREDAIERLGKCLENETTRPVVMPELAKALRNIGVDIVIEKLEDETIRPVVMAKLAKALCNVQVDVVIAKILFDALEKGIDISPILPEITDTVINGPRQIGREYARILLESTALKKIDISDEITRLVDSLNDPKTEHIADVGIALFGLAEFADRSKFIPDLEHIAENGRPDAQFYAIMALVKLGVERDLETNAERLKTTLHSVSLFERLSAVRILAQLIADRRLPLSWLVLFEPATIASNDTLKHNFIVALKTLAQGGERTAEYIMQHDSFFSASDNEIRTTYIEALGIAAKNGADISRFAKRLLAKLISSTSTEEETAAIKTLAHILKNEKTKAKLIKAMGNFCEENMAEGIAEKLDAFIARERMDRIPKSIEKLGNNTDEDIKALAVAFATAIIRSDKMARESAKNSPWFIEVIKRLGQVMKDLARKERIEPQ